MGLGVLPKEPTNEGPKKTLAKDMKKCERMRRKNKRHFHPVLAVCNLRLPYSFY